jgi:hypothetical protein
MGVLSTAYFPDRKAPRILMGTRSEHWGSTVNWSDDFGARWNEPAEGNVKIPADSSLSLNGIWALEPAPLADPEVVFAGVDPAALYCSHDRGQTFHPNQALLNHPECPYWLPGFGGLCLHTILPNPRDPKRMIVAPDIVSTRRSTRSSTETTS